MTHGNIVATAAAVMTVTPNLGEKDVYLAYMPLAHVFELEAEVISSESCCLVLWKVSNYVLVPFFVFLDCDVGLRLCNRVWFGIDHHGHFQQNKEGYERRCFHVEADSHGRCSRYLGSHT